MKCKCGFDNNINSKYCSECGENLRLKNRVKLPRMITIKEAHEIVFSKTISLTKIYDLVRMKSIPHVKVSGKILLDLDKTIEWWNKKLDESMKPINLSGLRKII